MALILKDATFIHWDTLAFHDGHIVVNEGIDGKIQLYDKFDEITVKVGDTVINCKGKLVTKSFAVGHHHVYSALARGMSAPKKTPVNFREILQYVWWTLDKALDREMIEASALATAIASAKAGSTFVIDHHASPNCIEGSLEIIANAFEKVGVGHLLCYEITDRDGLQKAQEGLDETENYLKNHQGLVGLHASFTVGDDTLKKAVQMAEKYNSGIHTHVAEDKYDQEHCLENYRKRVVERFSEAGVLSFQKTILGHCLHISESEREVIGKSPAIVVQNTESNLNNNVGYFNSAGLGDNIMLGTDGMHSDMLRSAQAAFFVGQGFDNIGFSEAYQRFRMVHQYLSLNGFAGDGENNLIVLDYDTPTEINSGNFLGHFIFGFNARHICHVISDGKLIVKDGIIQTVNEAEIHQFTREQSVRLWERMLKK